MCTARQVLLWEVLHWWDPGILRNPPLNPGYPPNLGNLGAERLLEVYIYTRARARAYISSNLVKPPNIQDTPKIGVFWAILGVILRAHRVQG